MNRFLHPRPKPLRVYIGSLIGILAVVYFTYHALQGERGLIALWQVDQEIAIAEVQLAELQARHDALEARVLALSDGSLDRDMLDERVRQMLNVVRPDEHVIILE